MEKGKIKVFVNKEQQYELKSNLDLQASYDSFVVGEASKNQIEQLKKKFPVEKISDFNRIQLYDAVIDTSMQRISEKGIPSVHPSYTHTKKLKKGSHHYLVQFVGPIKQEWLNKIKKEGGIICEPFPNYSYVVEMDDDTLITVRNMEFVNWIGHYDPQYRISSKTMQRAIEPPKTKNLKKLFEESNKNFSLSKSKKKSSVEVEKQQQDNPLIVPYKYSISFFTKKNFQQAKSSLKKNGIKVLESLPDANKVIVDIRNAKGKPAEILSNLSEIHGVKQIEDIKIQKLFNNIASGIMNATILNNDLGLTGKGEIVGIADTGIDSGDSNTIHPDFRERIKKIKSYPIKSVFDATLIRNVRGDDGPRDTRSGHGTHVAGSVLGNGNSSLTIGGGGGGSGNNVLIKGIAHESELVFQAIEQFMDWTQEAILYFHSQGMQPPDYGLFGIPENLKTLLQYAYTNGCRVHTNSWGSTGDFGKYDDQCEQIDSFIWNHKNFTILFAAGNESKDANHDGKIDFGSVTPPATAKNCIAVGASENNRADKKTETYGKWWPDEFPSSPIRNDPMTDSVTDVVAFSGRGPTNDGRIKPDVVAPGTFILSTRSRYIPENSHAWGKYPPNKDYFFMGGTSMATPLTAGGVAIIRQFLRTKANIPNPSAALVKATLIHGAHKFDYRYKASSEQTLFDMEQGWGLVNLEDSIAPKKGKIKYVDHNQGLRTGESTSIEVKIDDSSESDVPFKVTMVYTDYPGPTLINNLNLVVISPDGSRFNGNMFKNPTDSQFDTKNNVEVVFIEKPDKGKYVIEILASNISIGTQDFALVYSGQII